MRSIKDYVNSGLIKSGNTAYGGIFAVSNFGNIEITQCINTNTVEGTTNMGAIAGILYGTFTITECFYDIQMCKYKAVNNQDHPGVTGLPTHLLMNELAK